jgi:hypothetical protein
MTIEDTLNNLNNKFENSKRKREVLNFENFLTKASEDPKKIFRNSFQLFSDMINYYVKRKEESGGYFGNVIYDSSELFEKGVADKFFADNHFAKRLIDFSNRIRVYGSKQNKIYNFVGPPGSGKSLFLNNLVHKFEEYSSLEEGASYETVWKLGNKTSIPVGYKVYSSENNMSENLFEVPCPHHDHPILQVPKKIRKDLLDDLIKDVKVRDKIFNSVEYEWIFKNNPCAVCTMIYDSIKENITYDPIKIFKNNVGAKRRQFNRTLGEGIVVFGQGDSLSQGYYQPKSVENEILTLLKDPKIEYVFSEYAKTNNGIYSLMDLKNFNFQRMQKLHGIVSEGAFKVAGKYEEFIKSLFLTVSNPADLNTVLEEESFKDRAATIRMPYILDYTKEAEVLKSNYSNLESRFYPGVLKNLSKIIVASRLAGNSEKIKEWIKSFKEYENYSDPDGHLLKLELYCQKMPRWISEKDLSSFTDEVRDSIFYESEEGDHGISGRKSVGLIKDILSTESFLEDSINMNQVSEYFLKSNEIKKDFEHSPDLEKIVKSINRVYNFNVLEQVRESLYEYNKERISKDIQNYMYSVSFKENEQVKSPYTSEKFIATKEYFEEMEHLFIGKDGITKYEREIFRKKMSEVFAVKTLSQEIMLHNKNIKETTQYKDLFQKYIKNAKHGTLEPLTKNNSFLQTIKDFGNSKFEKQPESNQRKAKLLIKNLEEKFGYNEKESRQIAIYVLENYKEISKK